MDIMFSKPVEVDENELSDVRTVLAKTNTTLEKRGFNPIELVILSEEFRKLNETESYKVITFQLQGTLPKLEGYKFVAKIDHLGEGNILNVSPFYEGVIPEKYRESNSYCDHCNTNRKRNSTYLIQKEDDGSFMQVGSGCVGDFSAAVKGPMALDALWSLLSKLMFGEELPGEEKTYRGATYLSVQRILEWAICIGETIGYVSKRQAEESYGDLISTSDQLAYVMFPKNEQDEEFRKKVRAKVPDYEQRAQAMLSWVESFEERESLSDYEHNLLAIVNARNVEWKYRGYIASIPMAYGRHLAKLYHKDDVTSNHVGEVGKRETFNVKFVKETGFHTDYGYMVILTFETAEGDQLVWKTTSFDTSKAEIGNTYLLTGTVKKHSEFRGVKQTELNRCKLQETDG
jgi:hypothetical protein